MNLGPIDYNGTTTPEGYRCATCGATGCKLWRFLDKPIDPAVLACCECAGAEQGVDVSGLAPDPWRGSTCDIGERRVPAIPAHGDGGANAARAWWARLPTRAVKS